MNDFLRYMSMDPIYRKYHHTNITFSMWYAYYALWGTVMPTHASSYITIKSDDLKCYGYCSFTEEYGTHYLIEFQDKDNFIEHFSIIANGFTKEELIEIVESIEMN